MIRSLIVVLLLVGIPSAAIPCLSMGLRWAEQARVEPAALPEVDAEDAVGASQPVATTPVCQSPQLM